ncbi:MAG: hypothetical protein IKE45_04200 [Halomonas sp.]|nr:hypothetical protein [Halomonas sp.]
MYIRNIYSEKEYKALFYAGVLYAETDEIDVLITVLPVSHYKNEALRQGLIRMMQGEYLVCERRTINVKGASRHSTAWRRLSERD